MVGVHKKKLKKNIDSRDAWTQTERNYYDGKARFTATWFYRLVTASKHDGLDVELDQLDL